MVAEVVYSCHAGATIDQGNNVSGRKEDVGGMALQFTPQPQMCPQAGKRNNYRDDFRQRGEQIGRRRLAKVETKLVTSR